ncbi:hypothetical protein RhiirA4_537481 [Rhizophagus irregularis]|uniref:Uncharacterized protein n=1 Tax=Rhizophagus irregularis TaxID=588596 RepID=A0A2I1FWD6_9GLOM|nr:hypothetical protein RhiirA4_537481 [Rhizophagus irregularis]
MTHKSIVNLKCCFQDANQGYQALFLNFDLYVNDPEKDKPMESAEFFSTCIDKKNGTFLQKTTFQFLTQPDVVSAINSITADNIFDYYQQKMSNSKLSQVYRVIAQDLEEVLESNFFKEDTTRVLKDIKDTWVTWKKQTEDRSRSSVSRAKIDKWVEESVNVGEEKGEPSVRRSPRPMKRVNYAEIDGSDEEKRSGYFSKISLNKRV